MFRASRAMQPLPIDPLLPEIVRTLSDARALVLEAPPGAGKTTRVPPALLDAGLLGTGELLVAEPRRLAARLAARRVADERGERVGASIGYSVRFEDVSSRATRVRYVTEGVLTRRLLSEPELSGVSAVVLDEFHERHVATDLALALLERLRRERRRDLLLVVMSATLEAEPVARYLACPRVRSEGRSHPVAIEHLERPDDRPLEKQVVSAVKQLVRREPDGDLLVFLPGAAEIRLSLSALEPAAAEADLLLCPLHGDLSIEEQARAVEPAARRKVVLSTNVAESSVTIDGVTAVVDSGLARIASHSPWTGLDRLVVDKISRASAVQRAGRAGRTRPGRVLRLYTRGDFEHRREHDLPELSRLDLSEPLLVLHGSGVARPAELRWLEPPPEAALGAAETLLRQLGALDDAGRLTAVGKRMLDFPLHPRLARLLVEGERRGVAERAALVCALLGERDIRLPARTGFGAARGASYGRGPSDLLELVDRIDEADAAGSRRELGGMGLDARSVRAVQRTRDKLARLARDQAPPPSGRDDEEQALLQALLVAFPDRVARRTRAGQRELVLCTGGSARLSETSVVVDPPLLVAVDVEERSSGRHGGIEVRLASAIEPEWLLDLDTGLYSESDTSVWNAETARVERVSRLAYGSVVLEESRKPAAPSAEASEILARAARARGLERLADGSGLPALLERIAVLGRHVPEAGLPELGDDAAEAALLAACEGATSLAELSGVDLGAGVRSRLTHAQQRLLAEQAPERVTLPGGRSVPVHYEPGKSPWIESRLQDFFGMQAGPTICKGRLPLTLHLLAPNQRAVQVTTDLAGFWERHYPSIRRELMRRYPKHAWPEDGRTATPPPARPRR